MDHHFSYLRCTITSDAKINKEFNNKLAKASDVFGRLYKCMWYNKHLKKGTNISMYRSLACNIAQLWITYWYYLWLLKCFHQYCFWISFNIYWSDFVTSIEVLEKANITSIKAMLLKFELCWIGHISGMGNHHLPGSYCDELSSDHHSWGAPKKQFKNCLKNSLMPIKLTIAVPVLVLSFMNVLAVSVARPQLDLHFMDPIHERIVN